MNGQSAQYECRLAEESRGCDLKFAKSYRHYKLFAGF